MQSTDYAHLFWKKILVAGDLVIDATLGNAKDTAHLSECVGSEGQIWAFEIQQRILEESRDFLGQKGLLAQITLVHQSHETMLSVIPAWAHGSVKLIVFNLGYCPGSDKSVTTQPRSTLAALEASVELLAPDGLISLMVYRGHPTGVAEYCAIQNWLRTLDKTQWCIEPMDFTKAGSRSLGPVLFLLSRSNRVAR